MKIDENNKPVPETADERLMLAMRKCANDIEDIEREATFRERYFGGFRQFAQYLRGCANSVAIKASEGK